MGTRDIILVARNGKATVPCDRKISKYGHGCSAARLTVLIPERRHVVTVRLARREVDEMGCLPLGVVSWTLDSSQ